jgi:hypothetical protein
MSATNAFETAAQKYIMEGVSDATWTALAAATQFYISLHTASPGEAGDQTTSETAYTGYARISIARTAGGWTTTGGATVNDAEAAFAICTASPGGNLTYVGLGLSASGAGTLLEYNPLDNSIPMSVGTVPTFSIGELEFTCD